MQTPTGRRHTMWSSARFMGRATQRLTRITLSLMGAVVLLAAVAWAVLLFQILPRIGDWRQDLAEQATRTLGVTVRIGALQGRAEGMWPVLSLHRVELLDEQGRLALSLPEVSARVSLATLSPQALWAGEVRLGRLELVQPDLDVRRDTAGQIHVAGLSVSPQVATGTGASAGADWVLSQSLIEIRQGRVRWTDELRGRPTLSLQQVDLALRHRLGLGRRHHELVLAATPPREFGQRVRLEMNMVQPLWALNQQAAWWQRWWPSLTRPSQWQRWTGSAVLDLPHVDVQTLQRHVSLPVEVRGGQGAVRAALRLKDGRLAGGSLQLAVRGVDVRLAPELAPLSFRRLTGRLSMDHRADQTAMAFEQLAFELNDGLSWPLSQGRLVWRHAADPLVDVAKAWRQTQGGQAQVEHLDLALLARVADRLPLAPAHRQALQDLAPQGVVSGLDLSWDGAAMAPARYRVKARVQGLGLAESPDGMRPGLAQADVTVTATEVGGRADVAIQQGWLAFPGVFEESRIPLDRLKARVDWTRRGVAGGEPNWSVNVSQASFANADAAGTLDATWRTAFAGERNAQGQPRARLPGVLEMGGRLARGEATRVWRYLPLSIPPDTRDYVRQAFRSGHAEEVTFEVKGALDAFPFKDDVGGRFRVRVPIRQVVMDYVPPALLGLAADAKTGVWPAFTSLEGLLRFEGQRMLIEDARGMLGTMGTGRFALSEVSGKIEDLGGDDPHLTIQGRGAGPMDDLLRFLATSPVGEWTGGALSEARGGGRGALQLSLDIPLNRGEDTRVKGLVTLVDKDQASLRLSPSIPAFASLRGTIALTETQLDVQARTRVWGQEMVVQGKRGQDGVVRFSARGSMSAEGLKQAQEYPALARLAPHLSGATPVSVTVAAGARTEVQVTSTLQGIGAALPAPLAKSAAAVWPLAVTYRTEGERGERDVILVDVGNPQSLAMTPAALPRVRVELRRDVSTAEARVTQGLISLVQGSPGQVAVMPPLPARGVAAHWSSPTLDLDAWLKVADAFRGPAVRASQSDIGDGLPETVSIQTGALTLRQRTLKDVSATLAHPAQNVWRLQLNADQVAGQIEWAPEKAPLAAGPSSTRVTARLSRLSIPNAEAQALQSQATAQMLASEGATQLPALDIQIDQFEWRGLALGRLEVEAINRLVPMAGGAALPEWRLNRLRLSTPEAQLDASGNWAALGTPGRPRSAFGFTLDLRDSGALLTRLGLPQTLRGGKGQLTGQVNWLGSPLEPDPLTMSGDIKVQINAGQFLKADPGIAKLLGVLSLQSLPRRLTLDFRDLFQQGFAFDAIDGDVKVTQGVAATRNLRMRGVQAIVLMEGQADLAKETQNLHVFVVPQINAEAASLAYAAINPVIGIGTFIAQYLLRKQVADAGTQEFMVTGSWADPNVEKLERGQKPAEITTPRKPS